MSQIGWFISTLIPTHINPHYIAHQSNPGFHHPTHWVNRYISLHHILAIYPLRYVLIPNHHHCIHMIVGRIPTFLPTCWLTWKTQCHKVSPSLRFLKLSTPRSDWDDVPCMTQSQLPLKVGCWLWRWMHSMWGYNMVTWCNDIISYIPMSTHTHIYIIIYQ